MGFFSSVSKLIGGGSESKSGSQNSSSSGFALLPKEIKDVYTGYATDLGGQFLGGASDDLFAPLPQTEYETTALNSIGQGITPDADQLRSDINMQMNPYDQHVIDTINREAVGDYSILKQGLDDAGQFGSNRHILGANDIDLTRLNQIGTFKQGQYNQALDNSLNALTDSRVADAGLQMTAGDFLRTLDADAKQAPINAMTSFGQLLGVLPTSGGSESSGTSSSKSSSSKGIGSTIAGIAGAFSDERLKEGVKKVGEKNGFNLYEFAYKWSPVRFIGVMAQEVEKIRPDAVGERDGFKTVDYGKLGLEMELA